MNRKNDKPLFLNTFLRVGINNSTNIEVCGKRPVEKPQSVSRQTVDNPPDDYTLNLASHYWKCFDFRNRICTQYPIIVEHLVLDHLYLLSMIPEETASVYLLEVLTGAGCNIDVFRLFTSLYAKHFCDPASPFYNVNLFASALYNLFRLPETPEDHKAVIRNLLYLIQRKHPNG